MKLTRKRFLVAFVVTVAVVGGAWFAVAEHGPHEPPFGVTRAAYRALQFGMTTDEANSIVGQPALLFQFLIVANEASEVDENLGPAVTFAAWDEGGVAIVIGRNQDGLVCEKRFCSRPLLDRLLRQVRASWGNPGF